MHSKRIRTRRTKRKTRRSRRKTRRSKRKTRRSKRKTRRSRKRKSIRKLIRTTGNPIKYKLKQKGGSGEKNLDLTTMGWTKEGTVFKPNGVWVKFPDWEESTEPPYTLLNAISLEGSNGEIWEAVKHDEEISVAIKVLRVSFPKPGQVGYDLTEILKQEQTMNEIKALEKLKSYEGIIHLIDTFYCKLTNGNIQPYIVTELFEGDDLFTFIKADGALHNEIARTIMIKILFAIAYIHKEDYVHRDLKPDNILIKKVGSEYIIKIIDFGFAIKLVDGVCNGIIGTSQFVAPEVTRRLPYGKPADMFSLGVVLYCMLTVEFPFSKRKDMDGVNHEFPKQGEQGNFEISDCVVDYNGLDTEAVVLMKELFKEPDQRPTVLDVLKSEWIQGDDWEGQLLPPHVTEMMEEADIQAAEQQQKAAEQQQKAAKQQQENDKRALRAPLENERLQADKEERLHEGLLKVVGLGGGDDGTRWLVLKNNGELSIYKNQKEMELEIRNGRDPKEVAIKTFTEYTYQKETRSVIGTACDVLELTSNSVTIELKEVSKDKGVIDKWKEDLDRVAEKVVEIRSQSEPEPE